MKKPSGKSFVLAGAALITLLLSIAFFGFYGLGRQRFERGSFMTEAHLNVALLARGVAACAEGMGDGRDAGQPRGLPATTPPVPAEIAALRGKYTSAPSDWQSDGFRCAKFAITAPQRFQYRWERVSPDHGRAEASGDFDDDGKAEVFLHASVTCRGAGTAIKCEIGPVEASPWTNDAH